LRRDRSLKERQERYFSSSASKLNWWLDVDREKIERLLGNIKKSIWGILRSL